MPTEVKSTLHQLAVARKKIKDIEFDNKDGNVINDTNNDHSHVEQNYNTETL